MVGFLEIKFSSFVKTRLMNSCGTICSAYKEGHNATMRLHVVWDGRLDLIQTSFSLDSLSEIEKLVNLGTRKRWS